MPELPDAAAFELPPDWVCEVLSPSTEAVDRAEKMPIYAREGVGHLWLVGPVARTLEAFALEQSRWVVLGCDPCYFSCMSSFEDRARARALWPVRALALGTEELTDPRDTSMVDERLALVATLTREQWRLSGREIPTYSRSEAPGRIVRGGR